MSGLRDQFGRTIEYLRISVTDRCNFRCSYCMPLEGLPWLPKSDILSYEEIAEVVRQLAPLGLRRVRITGGEPTIRPQLPTLVRMLRGVPAVEDIALSTNGVRLPELAQELADAGLVRVNMSSDSLRPERIATADREAKSIVTLTRPRGYFGVGRDRMSLDGASPPPGVPAGVATVATSKLKLADAASRPIAGEFNDERIVGRVLPAADNQVTVLELTY